MNTCYSHKDNIKHDLLSGQDLTVEKTLKTQFTIYISDTPVTLRQSQVHKTYNENVNPKQGYNHAKFERSCFNSVQEKGNEELS